MKDTLGAHLAEAIRHAGYAGSYRSGYEEEPHQDRKNIYKRWEAQAIGKAAGHAFRAAELASDMGRIDEEERHIRLKVAAL